jgi:hypothetical protein
MSLKRATTENVLPTESTTAPMPWDAASDPTPAVPDQALQHPAEVLSSMSASNDDYQEYLAWKARKDAAPYVMQPETPSVQAPAHARTVLPTVTIPEGFDGLELDWTSFPTISLKNTGMFEDTDGTVYGSEFRAKIIGSCPRYIYRALTRGVVDDNRNDTAFSYDRSTSTRGVPIAHLKAMWEAQGKEVEEKCYTELRLIMDAPNAPYDGEWRLASIPAMSRGRFSGFFMQLSHLTNGSPQDQTVRFYAGDRVTKAKQPFIPWAFAAK